MLAVAIQMLRRFPFKRQIQLPSIAVPVSDVTRTRIRNFFSCLFSHAFDEEDDGDRVFALLQCV